MEEIIKWIIEKLKTFEYPFKGKPKEKPQEDLNWTWRGDLILEVEKSPKSDKTIQKHNLYVVT